MSEDAFLKSLIAASKPVRVVEIVSKGASRAELLLEASTVLECASDLEEGRVAALAARFGARFRRREGLTLNVLAALEEAPDLVLLGRDPNWYTVREALRLLARRAGSGFFPTVLVGHTGWPYGRRDAYPVLEAIPLAHLKPNAKRGVRPGNAELGAGGLFDDVHHALFENTGENGVLTAVEDFVAASDLPLEHVQVPAFYGVSVLVDRRRRDANAELAAWLGELVMSPSAAQLMAAVEGARIEAVMSAAAREAELARVVSSRADLADEMAWLRSQVARTAQREREDELRIAELEAGKAMLEEAIAGLERELAAARGRDSERQADRLRLEHAEAKLRERVHVAPEAPAPEKPRAQRPKPNVRGTNAAQAFATAVLPPGGLELARRRLAKLRRDPKLFFAHSRFGVARTLARFL